MFRKRILCPMRCWSLFTGRHHSLLVSCTLRLERISQRIFVFDNVRGTATGSDFMHKPELIDAAEASGLSRVPIRYVDSFFCFCICSRFDCWLCWLSLNYYSILFLDVLRPELGKGKPGQFGSSPREWYSGWSSMKTLVSKGLVAKSSNPAK